MPSNQILEAKQAKVAVLSEQIKNSVACVLVDYKGITVEDDTKLRKALREAGVKYSVEKNSILRFAFKECGWDFDEYLEGTTAIALSESDQTAPARVLGKYAEDSNGKFIIKAGFVEKDKFDATGVMALSKIPSKDTLLSMLLYTLQAPVQKLAATLQALSDSKSEASA